VASVADLAVRNFRQRIENITPTYARKRTSFRWIDENRIDPASTAGLERAFNVVWLGQTGHAEEFEGFVTDITERDAMHRFEVSFYYPVEVELQTRQDMALQDRHDVYSVLRNMDNRVGYSASVTTGVVVQTREMIEAGVDRDNDFFWRYWQQYLCRIFEPEI
jgi:hypothetical protein